MSKLSKLGFIFCSVYTVYTIGSIVAAKYFCSGWFCGLYVTTAFLPWSNMGFGTGIGSLVLMFAFNIVIVYLFGTLLFFAYQKITRK